MISPPFPDSIPKGEKLLLQRTPQGAERKGLEEKGPDRPGHMVWRDSVTLRHSQKVRGNLGGFSRREKVESKSGLGSRTKKTHCTVYKNSYALLLGHVMWATQILGGTQ